VIADALETDNPPTRIKVGTVAQQMTTARKAIRTGMGCQPTGTGLPP